MTNGGPNIEGACCLGTSDSVATNFASTPKQAEQHDNDQALSVSTRNWSLRFGEIWRELYSHLSTFSWEVSSFQNNCIQCDREMPRLFDLFSIRSFVKKTKNKKKLQLEDSALNLAPWCVLETSLLTGFQCLCCWSGPWIRLLSASIRG